MSSAPTLFDLPRARRSDPQTSRDAAQRVWNGWPALIIECLAMYGPASDDRICIRLNVEPRKWPSVKTARSRVTHAEDPNKRLIVDAGYSENGQTVWRHRDFVHEVETVEVRNEVV
jgi:hypothetical protein